MQDRNIFTIGRIPDDEDQLTEMLAWLVSAVPDVGATVMRLALDDEIDPLAVTVTTQQRIKGGRLDAVFESADACVVLESKLGSTYGTGQLEKYLQWLATECSGKTTRALLTLTQQSAPWPASAEALAAELGVRVATRRWEDLYDQLDKLLSESSLADNAQRLVTEFMELLTEEGLIPMESLNSDVLAGRWAESSSIIGHFHEYFRASKDTIATSLTAAPKPNRASMPAPDYIYQGFELDTGEVVTVGFWCSDDEWTLPDDAEVREVPVLWAALQDPEWEGRAWPATAAFMEASPPDGWHTEPERWYDGPCIWAYLDEVLGDGTFAEQQARLGDACTHVRKWVDLARDTAEHTQVA